MSDVLENTPTKLVIKLASSRIDWTVYGFDKVAGTARFERSLLSWKRRPIEVPLDQVAGLDPITFTLGGNATQYILLRLRAGKRRWMSGDKTADATIEAAKQMRAFTGIAEPEPGAAANRVPLIYRWGLPILTGVGVLLAAIVILTRVYGMFVLPGCDSDKSHGVVRDIFTKAGVKIAALTDVKAISSRSKDEKWCQGRVEIDDDFVTMGFRIYWDGSTATWQIIGAVGVGAVNSQNLNEARKATDRFLELARDSHRTGRPPRQSDPAVAQLLDKVFDLSAFGSEALAYSEINNAVQWYNTADRIGVVYILAGTGVNDMAQLPNDPNSHARTHRNVADFAPEIGRFLDYEVIILNALARAATAYTAFAEPNDLETDDFKKTLTDIRETIVQTTVKDLTSFSYSGLSDGWRRERLAVLKAVAPNVVKILLPEQAKEVREFTLKIVPYLQNADFKAELTAYVDTIAKP